MTISRDSLVLKLTAAALAFIAALLALRAFDGTGSVPGLGGSSAAVSAGLLPGATADERIAALRIQVEDDPSDPEGHVQLGLAYLQKVRDTGDPSFYPDAAGALHDARQLDPESFTATSGLGELALSQHDFERALRLGERARSINSTIASNYGVIADAQIELGRYAAAGRTLQHWVDLQPGLSSYARVSYFRELRGDLSGANDAIELAVAAAGGRENTAYLQGLLGDLKADRGDYAGARDAYRALLAGAPGDPAALAGLADLAAGRGDLDAAIRRYRAVVESLPVAGQLIALGEVEEAAGRSAAARKHYALAVAHMEAEQANGVNLDTERALFEADHGSPARAVSAGLSAWRAIPSVRSADAYSWALSQAGESERALRFSREAMRLGSRDPLFLFHAGIIARRAGRPALACTHLGRLLNQSPRFSPLYAPVARRAAAALACGSQAGPAEIVE
jgi:tetratricopeptide (TPR) repeat protein